MKRTKLCVLLNAGVLSMVFSPSVVAQPPPMDYPDFVFKSGPYTFSLREITKQRRFISGKGALDRVLARIGFETSDRLLGYDRHAKEILGKDDTGVDLTPTDEDLRAWERDFYGGDMGSAQDKFVITLRVPQGQPGLISGLKGKISVVVAKDAAELRFDNPLEVKGKTLEKEGWKVTLVSSKFEGKEFVATCEIDEPLNSTPGSPQQKLQKPRDQYIWLGGPGLMIGPTHTNEILIIGTRGNEVRFHGIRAPRVKVDSTQGGAMTFPGGKPKTIDFIWHDVDSAPRAVICRFPVGEEEKEIPFEFRDIPLP